MRALALLLAAALLAACGHSQIAYTPSAPTGITIKQAASIVEQGFYEDFSQQKPQSAMVTAEFIALSNGSVTRGVSLASASIYGSAIVGLGSTFLRTEEINQRIYFRSIGTPIVSKRNGRDNRYAVTIRLSEGVTARNVYFRSEQRAKEFADALVFLGGASARGDLGQQQAPEAPSAPPGQLTQDQQLDQLSRETGLSYEEYMRRYKAIMAQ